MMTRARNTKANGSSFDSITIEAIWRKGTPESGLSQLMFRKDTCGASMSHDRYGKTEQWGWEIDHIKPVSKGGGDELENLQPLQWENNSHKGDDWPDWSCEIKS